MTSQDNAAIIFWSSLAATAIFMLLVAALAYGVKVASGGEEIHHHAGLNEEVDQFYSTWRMPTSRNSDGNRVASCCNKQDCHTAEVEKRGNKIYARTDYSNGWLEVPQSRIESNYSDARESPDGRNHMCHSHNNPVNTVYCFTYGSGT